MPVAEGGQHAHRVVTDAGQDDPVVGDAQPGQVLMEVPVILQGLVPVSNDQTQARVPGKGGCVLFRLPARAYRPEAVLAAAVDVPVEVFRLNPTGAWRPFQRLLHRPGAHHGHTAEQFGVAEPESPGPVAAHAEAIEQSSLAGCYRAPVCLDVGTEFLDDDGLKGCPTIGPVNVHPHPQAVDEHEEEGLHPAGRDGLVNQ